MHKIAALTCSALAVASLGGTASPAHSQNSREFVQTIWLNGFKCTAVQRDSIVNPANEVFFVMVTNAPTGEGIRGTTVGTFGGVVPGYSRKLRNRVWSGPQQPLSLRVMMFERDAGKETGATLARTMVAYGTSLMSTGKGGKTAYPNRPGAAGKSRYETQRKPKGAVLREDDQIDPIWTRAYATVFDRALGLSHDPMGYDRQTFGRGDWSSRPTYSEKGIRYHFHTTHRQNGANCRAYFLIERGREIERPAQPQPPQPMIASANQFPPPTESFAEPYDPAVGGQDNFPPNNAPPYDSPPPIVELPPPPPPRQPEPDWFRVRFKNLCDVPISLSYSYKNPSRGWVKRGWGLFDPGEAGRMEGNTLTPEIFIYTSRGRVSGSFDPERIKLAVRRKGFDVDRATSFKGDDGARMVPFNLHVIRDTPGIETIAIRDCDEWVAGKLLSTQEIAQIERLRDWRERQAQLAKNSALNEAAFAGDVKAIKAALKSGANINNRSSRLGSAGATPLHLATMGFHGDAINLLLDKGADAAKITTSGDTVFHSALYYTKANRFFDNFPGKAFARLVNAGADPQQADRQRRTPFERIARRLTPQWVKAKLAQRTTKPKKDSDYLSFLASRTTVNINRKHHGVSPFSGHTALHTAAYSGHRPLAKALLANGADRLAKDGRGQIPRQLASAWPQDFQELFGPLPEPQPPQNAARAVTPQPIVQPQKSDPAKDAERRRMLIERGVLAPEEDPPANSPN